MSKKIITIFAILASTMAFSQVGIGTNTPSSKSILDLTATDKGLLLPRMTTAERTAIAPTATTDKSMQVFDTTTNTIWFWNGTVWVEQGAKNIYDSNGDVSPTATANRTVTFTNGGSLNFDTNSLFVDATNNRVGIGTNAPTNLLDVKGDGITPQIIVSTSSNGINDNYGTSYRNSAAGAHFGYVGNLGGSLGSQSAAIIAGGNKSIAFKVNGNSIDVNNTANANPNFFIQGNGGTSGGVAAIGNVGIGTTAPVGFLHINRTGNPCGIVSSFVDGITLTANTGGGLSGPGFYFESLNGTVGQRLMKVNYTLNGSNEAFINYQAVSDNGNASVRDVMAIFHNGRVGIGTTTPVHPLQMASGAHVTVAGVWTNASDSRLKSDILASNYGLTEVLKLRPVQYTMNIDKSKQVGFIAQEVKKIIPEVVSGIEGDISKGETLGVSYGNLVPVLTKAIQEQQALINQLLERIEKLEKK